GDKAMNRDFYFILVPGLVVLLVLWLAANKRKKSWPEPIRRGSPAPLAKLPVGQQNAYSVPAIEKPVGTEAYNELSEPHPDPYKAEDQVQILEQAQGIERQPILKGAEVGAFYVARDVARSAGGQCHVHAQVILGALLEVKEPAIYQAFQAKRLDLV